MSKKIRILFYGDSSTVATGFGTVSKNILNGLHATGKYDISVLGINYFGNPHSEPFPIWPIGIGSRDPYGRQRAVDMMFKDFEFDVLFLFQDSFILSSFVPHMLPKLRNTKNFATVGYYPVDGVPKKEWIDCMNMCDFPVAYTEFGKKESILACPEIANKLSVIPHGINTKDFHPLPKDKVEAFRKNYFGSAANKFIVTNVNRNQQRKDIPRTLMAFREFKKLRPDSVGYIHCASNDQGWNLPEVIKSCGLKINEDVILPGNNFEPNQGFPISVVNAIYNASDVVISTTLGEGYGLSSIESMACKTPVIFPNNTALTEIVGEDRGYLVSSGKTINDYTILPHDNEVKRPLTDVAEMVDALVHVYDNRDEARVRAENAHSWICNNLIWDKHIVPQWDAIIERAVSACFSGKLKAAKADDVVLVEDI
jgi:glycosyltransferase involved in cell wall biosynthesis